MPGLVPGIHVSPRVPGKTWLSHKLELCVTFVDMKPMSAITIRYTSRRSEVWQWYWRLWRKKLWMYHAYYFICISVIAISLGGQWPPHERTILYGLLTATFVTAFFIIFPQLLFKPHERSLTANEGGIDTSIGRKNGTVRWEETTTIEDTADLIMVARKNGNAFLIPRRAFKSDTERNEFLASIRMWQANKMN